jgi:D-serine deaminase-like pyridoxal phosphate-dependent protein
MFGKVTTMSGSSWVLSMENVFVSHVSQEHGVIKAPHDFIDRIDYGDILVILPVHSCLTANMFSTFQTLEGQQISSFRV